MEPDSQPASQPQLAVVVKLGGAAITHKHSLESLNAEVLEACARLLAALHQQLSSGLTEAGGQHGSGTCGNDGSSSGGAPARLVVVHGAGSFGHQTAAAAGVAAGGIHSSAAVRRGFAATRASVTKLNRLVVQALLAAGVPAVGLSPCGAWVTRRRAVAADGCGAVAALLHAGLVPVLHGDAVLDEELGCTILSGDVIISRLCERLHPPVVAFLTNVDGIYDRPPEQPGAQLISRIEVHPSQPGSNPGTCSGGSSSRSSSFLPGGFKAYTASGEEVAELQTSAAAHDTTGGVATKVQEAAAVARLGAEVRIARAGSPAAAAACSPQALPPGWKGTLVVRQGSGGAGGGGSA